MKKSTLLPLLLAATLGARPAHAQQETTIAEARAKAPAFNATTGPSVTVRGVVTNGPELGVIRYVQDKTGGLGIYSVLLGANVRPGDSVLVTGTLVDYRGLLELNPVSSLEVLAGNQRLPPPITVNAGSGAGAAFVEANEGRLVRLNGVSSITTTAGAPVAAFQSTTYRVNNDAATPLYINAASSGPDGLIGKPAPGGTYDVVGIMSQFTTAAPGTSGYQLLPRLYSDFIQGSTPNLSAAPVPTAISSTGFTVNFTTQNAGSTQLSYGTSPTGPFTAVGSAALAGTSHALALTGLTPATIYYVQAISTNATGQSISRLTPLITASLSSGKMRTYFNNPVDNSLALSGNQAVYLPQGHVADTLASYIDRAQQTVDLAIYNWNSPVILAAVNAAQARGVRVRVIYEDDNSNVSLAGLSAAIGRTARPTQPNAGNGSTPTSAIMHNKFVIIDAEAADAGRPWVWTGSTNWTPAQLATDRNNVITVQDQSLARVYTVEFEEMWGGSGPQPGATRFGSRKTDNTPHYLSIGGRAVESWFSPTDNVNGHLIEAIRTADNDLHVAAMLITQTSIGNALKAQIQDKNIGACSELLTNSIAAPADAVYNTIKSAPGLAQRTFLNAQAGIMHHKYLLVDAGAPLSDPLVFVGSHNWTLSADTENDENTLVVHDERIVNQYYQEFAQRIADQGRAGVVVCRFNLGATATATRPATVQSASLRVYPNPAAGRFQVAFPTPSAARNATLTLRDLTGRVVFSETRSLTGAELSVDAPNLQAGVYLLQLTTAGAVQVGRVVVE